MTSIAAPTHDCVVHDLKKAPAQQSMLFIDIVVASMNVMRPERSDRRYL
jgi:hypothetical protein